MKYQIGQALWWGSFEMEAIHITCPDCGGTGRLRVTFHDETQVSIDCRNCCCGYDPPRGYLVVYERKPRARLSTVTGVEVNADGARYHTNDCYIVEEKDLFENKADAELSAQTKADQATKDERERIANKEKPTRTWAFNASYHRQCIKRAQKDIEYHTAKLAVAAIKAKEKAT